MDLTTLQSILTIGETVAVEFKRCGNGIESDTYETVCSFLNRFGGDLFMGVLDDGTVLGVSQNAASDMIKNFIKVLSNPTLFSPTVYLVPEIIKYDENRIIIHVHIPPSAEVHSYTAKFVIKKEQTYIENANRATHEGLITVDNLEPNPKNPIIASFFRNIGYAEQLGSGVRNLFKYSKYYSGQEPQFIEGDIFKIMVPLDDEYSFDFGQTNQTNQTNQTDQLQQIGLSENELKLLKLMKVYPDMTNVNLADKLEWPVSRVKYYIQKLKQSGKIIRKGNNRNGSWEVL